MSPTSVSGGYILAGGSISPASLKGREEDLPTANLEQRPYNISIYCEGNLLFCDEYEKVFP
mgnify:CR=1 FL=1